MIVLRQICNKKTHIWLYELVLLYDRILTRTLTIYETDHTQLVVKDSTLVKKSLCNTEETFLRGFLVILKPLDVSSLLIAGHEQIRK